MPLPHPFDQPLLHQVLELLQNAIIETYDIAAERHDELIGDDGHTFGSRVWRNSWFRAEDAVSGVVGVKTARPKNSLVIECGGTRIRLYSAGPDEMIDVRSIAMQEGSITRFEMAQSNQLIMDFGEPGESGSQISNFVILHAGNPVDGCCAIWLGAPRLTREGEWDSWIWIENIWSISRVVDVASSSVSEDVTDVRDLPSEEPEVELREESNEKEQGNNGDTDTGNL